ncbi:chromate transporter [Hydrogenophaga sp. SL48]|nr:chromate transporter [Hydrogenophaga sp. SL48]
METGMQLTEKRPASRSQMFLAFSILSMQGFGGVMAIARRELVEKRGWLTPERFLADWAVAHVLPGPNVVNLSVMVGDRFFGWTGAVVAVAGLFTFPLLLVLLLAVGFESYGSITAVQGALKGIAAVVTALIASTAAKMLPSMRAHPGGRLFCLFCGIVTLALVLVLRWPLPWILGSVGLTAWAWTYYRLGAHPKPGAR